jgi:hypothetical protein
VDEEMLLTRRLLLELGLDEARRFRSVCGTACKDTVMKDFSQVKSNQVKSSVF